jgi:opacity protein-like surface antigen
MWVFLQMLAGILLGQEKYGYEVGPYAGEDFWKSRTFQVGPPQALPPINFGYSYQDKPVYGLRFNLLSRRYWGGELDYSYQANTNTLTRPALPPTALTGNVQHFFYNEIFYPARYRDKVTPFATAGIGLAAYHLSHEARALAAAHGIGGLASMDTRFAFNYGVGVKARLSGHFGIRGDLRHIFSDGPSYGLPKQSSNRAQIVLPIEGKMQTYEASGGIYFRVLK